jgi:hypothetical protein
MYLINAQSEPGNLIIHENKTNEHPKRFAKGLLVLIFILHIIINYSYSQNYDLIVTAAKDSIACHIDSISGNAFYIEMRYKNKWIHTYLNKNQVADYQPLLLSKNDIYFKRGSSYFMHKDLKLINQVNRNMIYGTASYLLYHYSVTANYERVLYISNNTKRMWTFRAGFGIIDTKGKIIIGTFNNLLGKGKNKFEMNIGATYINEPHSYGPHFISIVLNAGYRRQKPGGKFVLRTGFGIPEGLYFSLGYRF